MFERLQERARRAAEAAAAARRRRIAGRLAEALPAGIAAAEGPEGVTLSGRGLKRRIALESRLRALLGGLK